MSLLVLVNRKKQPIQPEFLRHLLKFTRNQNAENLPYRMSQNIGIGGYESCSVVPSEASRRGADKSGAVWAAIDGHIYNRPELCAELRDGGPYFSDNRSNADFVSSGYQLWGRRVLEKIIGDFSLVIWDPNQQSLICARDKTGQYSLYYFADDEWIIVASELLVILQHPAVKCEVNEEFLAEYLADEFVSFGETFYKGIKKLERGRCLTINDEEIAIRRYWQLNSLEVEGLRSRQQVVEKFMDTLKRSISCSIGDSKKVVVLVSGGLDSTSILSVAYNLGSSVRDRLCAISLVFDELKEVDEREFLETVLSIYPVEVHHVRGDEFWPLKDLSVFNDVMSEGPCQDATLLATKSCLEQAKLVGADTVLTGVGADLLQGSGLYYTDLMNKGRILRALQGAIRDPAPFWGLLFRYFLLPFIPSWVVGAVDRIRGGSLAWPTALSQDFLSKTKLRERLHDAKCERKFQNPLKQQAYQDWLSPYHEFLNSNQRCMASLLDLNLRHPFMNPEVVQFIFSLSPEWWYVDGRTKVLIREAMEKILPEKVRMRVNKTHFDALLHRGLRGLGRSTVESLLLSGPLPLVSRRNYVDKVKLEALLSSYWNGNDRAMIHVWLILTTELWLRWIQDQDTTML